MNFAKMLVGRYSTEIPEGAGVARWRRQARRAGCPGEWCATRTRRSSRRAGIRDREVVKQSMADDACLDEDVVCVELALDVVAVLGRGAVKMLVAIVAAQRLHVLHPEVIAERTDLAHSLLEGERDLESQAVKTNDLDGLQRGVCAHEQARTSCWMN